MSFFKNFQHKMSIKTLVLFGFIFLVQLNVGCTSRRSNIDEFAGNQGFNDNPFGDLDASEDDIFGSDFNFDEDDFMETNVNNIDGNEILDADFNVNVSGDSIQSCIPSNLFPNLGGLFGSGDSNLGCLDDSQVGVNGTDSTLQILLMQSLYSFGYMNECLNAAIKLDAKAKSKPQEGFILAQLSIVQCYRNIHRVLAASRAYEMEQRAKMQAQEKSYIELLRLLLKDEDF